MPAPAVSPPSPDSLPPALRKPLKPLIDYVAETHIEDIEIEMRPDSKVSKADFIRGQSGVIVRIVLGSNITGGFPPPPTSGTFVLGAVGGVIQWIATTTC